MKAVLSGIAGLLLIAGCTSEEPPCFKPGKRWFIEERDSPETATKPRIPDCPPTPKEIAKREETEAKLNALTAIVADEFLTPRPVPPDEAVEIDRIVALVGEALRADKVSRITVQRGFLISRWEIVLTGSLGEVCFWPPDFKPVSCIRPWPDTVDPRGPKGSGR